MTQYNLGHEKLSTVANSSDSKEVVANAIGGSGFTTDDTAAGRVNPEYWDQQLRDYTEDMLNVAEEAEVFDRLLDSDGDSINVQIDVEPAAASAVAETDDVSISELDYNQVTFTPSEYAKAYQVSDKEMRRAFFDVMDNVTKKIGYAFAINREDSAISTIESGANETLYADSGVSAKSDLASSDTMDYEFVTRAVRQLRENQFQAARLHVHPKQFQDLAQDPNFTRVNEAGTQETLRSGQIGQIYGVEVFENNRLTVDTSVSPDVYTALMVGRTETGDRSFGIARKLQPEIRSERHELGRYTDIVGVEEWDMQTLRGDGLVKMFSA